MCPEAIPHVPEIIQCVPTKDSQTGNSQVLFIRSQAGTNNKICVLAAQAGQPFGGARKRALSNCFGIALFPLDLEADADADGGFAREMADDRESLFAKNQLD